MLWATIQTPVGTQVEPEFRGDHHFVTEGRKRLAHKLFVRKGAVYFSSIEEGNAAFHGCADQGDHLLLIFSRAIIRTHAHAAEPESRDFQMAVSKFAFLHFLNSSPYEIN